MMRRIVFALAFGACLAGAAAAEDDLPPEVLGLGILGGWRGADGVHVAAIEIDLAPGWHTYWRVPGSAGVPPEFDWSASDNLAAVAYDWPRPVLFETYGEATLGFKDRLVLPVRLTPAQPGAPIEARVDLFFGVCKDICIPASARLSARLDPAAAPEGRSEIEASLATRPRAAAEAGIAAARCALEPGSGGHRLLAEVTFDAPPGPGLFAVIEAEERPDLWIGAAETRTEGRVLTAVAPVAQYGEGGLAIDRGALRLTLLDAARAIDVQGCAGR